MLHRSMEHHYKIAPPFQHLRRGVKGEISLKQQQVLKTAQHVARMWQQNHSTGSSSYL